MPQAQTAWDNLLADLDGRYAASQNGQDDEPARYCDCRQLVIRGVRQPAPRYHDCEYVRARNALIGEAEKLVSFVEVVKPKQGSEEEITESRAKWTRCFSIAMDELAKPLLNGANGTNIEDRG